MFYFTFHRSNFTLQLSNPTVKGKRFSECIYRESQHGTNSRTMRKATAENGEKRSEKRIAEEFPERTKTPRDKRSSRRRVGGEKCFMLEQKSLPDRQLNHHNFLSLCH